MIRLLLADDHRMFREGLRRLLSDEPDMQVVAEASTAQEALQAIKDHHHDLDVAVLDMSMPGRSGAELIGQARAQRPDLRILVLSMHDEESHVTQALRAGADGYATKELAAAEINSAIRRVRSGGRFLCPAVAERLALGVAFNNHADCRHAKLSEREYRVFEMLVAGKRGWEIASELSLSEKTVSTHKVNLLKKMNMTNRTELIRYAIREQLVAA